MPAPSLVVEDSVLDFSLALPPPLPLLTFCRESRSAPLYHHSFLASSSAYTELTEPTQPADGDDDSAEAVILLTSPAATYKEQGREISGLCRAFSRPSVSLPADSAQQPPSADRHKRTRGTKLLPRHPPLVPSKSSPALHRSPSKSPPPLPVHHEREEAIDQQQEDKHYSPSDCTSLLTTQSTSVSSLVSTPSLSTSYLSSSSTAIFSPSAYRSVSAYSVPSKSVSIGELSAHVNPFHSQAGVHRSVTASYSVRGRQRRVADSRKDDMDGRAASTASTASTCSMTSSSLSLSTFTSPLLDNGLSPYISHVDHDNDGDVDSDSDDEAADDDERDSLSHHTPSSSPPSHFTFQSSHSMLASSSSFSSSSSSSNTCFSPHSPLFDTSLCGGRHSADPQLSAGIGVFAGQLQALRRLRSANALTSPVNNGGSSRGL